MSNHCAIEDYGDERNSYHWESTFPVGSGAGQASYDVFYGSESDSDECEREDEEVLRDMLQQIGNSCRETYLTDSHAFISSGGSAPAGGTTIRYNQHGYSLTDKIPPKFDGNDLYSFIKAAKYWYEKSTLQDRNNNPCA